MFVRHALIMGSNSRLGTHVTQEPPSSSNSQSTASGKFLPSTQNQPPSHLSSSLRFPPTSMTSTLCISRSKISLRNSMRCSASLALRPSTQSRLPASTRCTMPTIRHHYFVCILCSRPSGCSSYFPQWVGALLRKQAGLCRG